MPLVFREGAQGWAERYLATFFALALGYTPGVWNGLSGLTSRGVAVDRPEMMALALEPSAFDVGVVLEVEISPWEHVGGIFQRLNRETDSPQIAPKRRVPAATVLALGVPESALPREQIDRMIAWEEAQAVARALAGRSQ